MPDMIINLLLDLLYVIIIGTVPVVAKYVISFLVAKKEQIEISTENKVLSDTVNDAVDLIIKAVNTVSQTYVDGLKKEGKFTEDAQKEAFEKAFSTAKMLISEESLILLGSLYTDVDSWIRIQIESYILESKKS